MSGEPAGRTIWVQVNIKKALFSERVVVYYYVVRTLECACVAGKLVASLGH